VADPVKGQIPFAFVVVKNPATLSTPALEAAMRQEVLDTVDRQLGGIARPGAVHFVTALPKTRSGKLLRRTIQALAEGRDPGDLTTLEDLAALEQVRLALAVKR
jgi:propionyl-CoA synthetase